MTTSSSTYSGGMLRTEVDTSKTFIGDNKYETGDYTNSTGGDLTLAEGTVMGRIAATNKLIPCDSAAVDGSQNPVGILATEYEVANGASANLTFCKAGDVAEEKVVFQNGTDTLATDVNDRTYRDRIGSDTVGINLVASTELTNYDN